MKRPGRLEITTRIGCSVNCVYCPQSLLLDKYFHREDSPNPERVLSLDNYKQCIDKLPEGTRIDFSGMVEPWLNPECTHMVLYAHKKGFPIAIYTTLVGMTKEDFEKIKDIPCEEFVLHIPDDKSNAHIEVTEEYIALLDMVINYKRESGSKLVTGYSCHAGVHPSIISAIPKGSKLIQELHNRAGNIDSEYVDKKINKGHIICINCDNSVHHNVLLPDGTVLLCCMDYGMKHILGNLLKQSYKEIHESEEALRVVRGMVDEKEDILCRTCVNAKNINEVYDNFFDLKEWNGNLLKQYDQRLIELEDYKDWVKNLEKSLKDCKSLNEDLKKQNAEFLKYNQDHKRWNEDLQKQNQDYKNWNEDLQEQNAEFLKYNQDYKKWVENLQEEIEEKKTVLEDKSKSEKEIEARLEEQLLINKKINYKYNRLIENVKIQKYAKKHDLL